jgi:hypothetical protein
MVAARCYEHGLPAGVGHCEGNRRSTVKCRSRRCKPDEDGRLRRYRTCAKWRADQSRTQRHSHEPVLRASDGATRQNGQRVSCVRAIRWRKTVRRWPLRAATLGQRALYYENRLGTSRIRSPRFCSALPATPAMALSLPLLTASPTAPDRKPVGQRSIASCPRSKRAGDYGLSGA